MERRFDIKREEQDFLIGKLDRTESSGAYLSPEFLARLQQLIVATQTRIKASGDTRLPDALKNLLGVLGRLLTAHQKQLSIEFEASAPERQKAIEEMERLLKDLGGNDNGPRRV